MAASLAGRLRRLWFNVHLWLGVGLMAALIPIGASGALLVWERPLDRALHPARYAVTGTKVALPLSAYADVAATAFAGKAQLAQLSLPERPGDPVIARGRIAGTPGPNGRPRMLNAWIDPPTGAPLEVAERGQNILTFMHRLHGHLMIPKVGRKVVGWMGWALFASSATGLWLWWPRGGAILKGLRWRRGPSTLFNLHHVVGFWICAPLAVLSLTGVYMSFPQTSRAVIARLLPQTAQAAEPGAHPGRPPTAGAAPAPRQQSGPATDGLPPTARRPKLTLDQVVARAREGRPQAPLEAIDLPVDDNRVWRVRLTDPDTKGALMLQVVDATGEVRPEGGPGQGDPLMPLIARVHVGAAMGPVWQVVITLGGLAPPVLGITGLIMWLRSRRRRAAQGVSN